MVVSAPEYRFPYYRNLGFLRQEYPYSADDGNTEVFYFKNATATFLSFTHEPEQYDLWQ